MISVKERYRNDPVFYAIVETFRAMIRGSQTTLSELREASILAAYIEEMENPSPVLYRIKKLARDLLKEDF